MSETLQGADARSAPYVLIGDGESPHLLKWARALAPRVDLWAVSSRGFSRDFDAVVPAARRLALATAPKPDGGNAGILLQVPRLVRWLRQVKPAWIHAHYVTSHGTLAWAARHVGVRAPLIASAWGTDILVTPERSAALRWLTSRVLQACSLTTSDSEAMAARMRRLGAREVMVFPFGLESMPEPRREPKDRWLFFANRALEPLYDPHRVLVAFASVAAREAHARLVVANDGSLRPLLERDVVDLGLAGRVTFTGRLDASRQAVLYSQAQWYVSLPRSDSVSVSVLEAMAHGCIPILSDLPANRELVQDGINGVIVGVGTSPDLAVLGAMLSKAADIERTNREWVERNALFDPAIGRFLERVQALGR